MAHGTPFRPFSIGDVPGAPAPVTPVPDPAAEQRRRLSLFGQGGIFSGGAVTPVTPPTSSLFKTNRLSALLGGVRNFIATGQAGAAQRATTAEREEAKAFRERQFALQKRQVDIQAASAKRRFDLNVFKEANDIATKAGIPFGMVLPVVQQAASGDLEGASESLNIFSQAAGLGDFGGEYFTALIAQKGAVGELKNEDLTEALKAAALKSQQFKDKEFGNLLAQEELLSLKRKVAEADLKKVETEAELGASPELIARNANAALGRAVQYENIAENAAARMAQSANPQASALAQALLGGGEGQAQALGAIQQLGPDSPLKTLADIVIRAQENAAREREFGAQEFARIGAEVPQPFPVEPAPLPEPPAPGLTLPPARPEAIDESGVGAAVSTAGVGGGVAALGQLPIVLPLVGEAVRSSLGVSGSQKVDRLTSRVSRALGDSKDAPRVMSFFSERLSLINPETQQAMSDDETFAFLNDLRRERGDEYAKHFILLSSLGTEAYQKAIGSNAIQPPRVPFP